MKFVIETVSNCDSNSNMIRNEAVRALARQQGFQAGKKLISTLFCCCCCVDNPSSSLLIQQLQQLGIPPTQLSICSSPEDRGHFVISHIETINGQDKKTPLIFTANANVAKALLQELNEVYITSNQMSAFQSGKLKDLDSKAKVWSQLFGLPAVSKGTQSLNFNVAFVQSGQPQDQFARTVRPTYEVHSLSPVLQESTSKIINN